jgi:hypothetical protein
MPKYLKCRNENAGVDELHDCGACSPYKGIAIACCCVAMSSLVPVVLVQFRVFKRLPDPPGSIFASTRIVTSKKAHPLGIPDGVLGLGSYSVTLILLIYATPSRPLVRGLLRAKLLMDGTVAARKARGQMKQFGQICSWCMGTAIATAGVIYFARKAREAERRRTA